MKQTYGGGRLDYEIILHHLYQKRPLSKNDKAFTLTLASITGQEGVSTIADGLSKYLASIEGYKVLLVSNISSRQVNKDQVSLFDALSINKTDFDELPSSPEYFCLKKMYLYNSDYFGFYLKQEWLLFWEEVTNEFDAVIVDSSSFQSVLPIAWNQITEQTVLVIDSQKITKQVLTRFKGEIESNNYNISGFILNNRRYPIPELVYNKLIRR